MEFREAMEELFDKVDEMTCASAAKELESKMQGRQFVIRYEIVEPHSFRDKWLTPNEALDHLNGVHFMWQDFETKESHLSAYTWQVDMVLYELVDIPRRSRKDHREHYRHPYGKFRIDPKTNLFDWCEFM